MEMQTEPVPLCVTCGVCCTDAFFRFSTVTPEESARLHALGFPIETENGREIFTHACTQLRGAACNVYEARPATCRKFFCTTLTALGDGAIDRAEADRRVTILKAAVRRVREHLAQGERIWEFRTRIYADPEASPQAQLALVSLDMLADRYFKPRDRRFLS